MNEKIIVYVTKNALRLGIIRLECEICKDLNSNMIDCCINGRNTYLHKPHWHLSESAAKKHAEEMRTKKIASLQRTIERLKNMSFD
jgi:hypothetical protein